MFVDGPGDETGGAKPKAVTDSRLKVVLCWHMHQPQYRDLTSGWYQHPWSYLHAIKDYVDMAAHLEVHPTARAVVNFAPVLLEQLDDYATQVYGFLTNGLAIPDPLLAALGQAVLPTDAETRLALVRACRQANETRMIHRFPSFHRLTEVGAWLLAHPENAMYLSEQYLADLLVWYHLAWLGESVRREDLRVQRLMEKGGGYTLQERRELLQIIGQLLSGLIPRYQRLAESGRLELSVSPYAHPILPLLIDLGSAREAMPNLKLPLIDRYPGGEERARWQIEHGIEVFKKYFGFNPAGCWPSEGGVSAPVLSLLSDTGFTWAASGQGVLANSLGRNGHAVHADKEDWLYRPYRLVSHKTACFFRDDGFSDLIGFSYAGWHADDAVGDLTAKLETVAERSREPAERVVSIIMDGENAWEHYPENGHHFLNALYQRLGNHPRLHLTTYSEYLREHAPATLSSLTAGSWIYGSFSTWIGDEDKNRGWDMLGEAKRAFDAHAVNLSGETLLAAERQLGVCEGSDWFWWLGDANPQAVSDFEHLYRRHLSHLYRLLGQEPPDYLSHPFARGRGSRSQAGSMRPGSLPTI
jgi:alpha-amylase/alpha-mannosidase (GH57 family)